MFHVKQKHPWIPSELPREKWWDTLIGIVLITMLSIGMLALFVWFLGFVFGLGLVASGL